MGTSLRQTRKASSFISTKLNLASHISSNNDRKYLVSVLGTRAEGRGVGGGVGGTDSPLKTQNEYLLIGRQ